MAGLELFLTTTEFEIEAFIEMNNGNLTKKVKIVRKKGQDKGIRFEYKKNLKGVSRTKSNLELFTKLFVYGKEQADGTRLNLKNINQVKNENGVNEFAEYVIDHSAQYKFNKNKKYTEGIILNDNIEDEFELLAFANAQLNIYNHPKFEYTVELSLLNENIELGDEIYVIDKELNLYISSRVIEKQISSDKTKNTVQLGEFITVEVSTPSEIWEMRRLINQTKEDIQKNMYKIEIQTPNGMDFSDGMVLKPVIARVFQFEKDITEELPKSSFKWELIEQNNERNEVWELEYEDKGNMIEVDNRVSNKTLRLRIYEENRLEVKYVVEQDFVFQVQRNDLYSATSFSNLEKAKSQSIIKIDTTEQTFLTRKGSTNNISILEEYDANFNLVKSVSIDTNNINNKGKLSWSIQTNILYFL
jgi:hypothetical protein